MNYYQLLGVDQNASQKAIKNAYKKLAFQYHPDKNPGNLQAENMFKEINNAYQTLSDPQKKALYDLKINYAEFQQTFTYEKPAYRYRNYRQKKHNYHKVYRKFNTKRNRVANWWALGFLATICIAYFIMTSVIDYMNGLEQEKIQAQEENIIYSARQKYTAGILNEALSILQEHLNKNGNRKVVNDLKKEYLEEIKRRGYNDFYNRNYEEALYSLKILFNYGDSLSLDFYDKVAESSRKVGNYHDAIESYQYIARKAPENLEAHLQIALIYTYDLKEYRKALKFYHNARNLTIKNYIEEYGKAFVLVFTPEQIPETHYLLYSGLGLASLKENENISAHKALDWAVILRPNRPEAYYLKGLAYQNTSNTELACKAWSSAHSLGLEEAGKLVRLNCP